MQSSGRVQNDNDILQEKFQLGSDNHFYRIKSQPTSAKYISILSEFCSKIPYRLKAALNRVAKRRQTRRSVIISGILNKLANKAALFRTVGNGYVGYEYF